MPSEPHGPVASDLRCRSRSSASYSKTLAAESAQLRLQRLYDRSHYKPAVATMSVPRPKGVVKPDGSFAEVKFGGEPLRDVALLSWCAETLAAVTGRTGRE